MDDRIKDLKVRGDKLFSSKTSVDTLWQRIAREFYPERAQFAGSEHYLGEEFARDMSTGVPMKMRRDLGNAIGALMRPRAKQWFKGSTQRPDRLDHASLQWLESSTRTMRRAMYDRISGFTRATKEGDNDYVTFGQCVISVEMNREDNALLYRNWHMKDVAWAENEKGQVDQIYAKWRPTARYLGQKFKDKLTPRLTKLANDEPYCEVDCRRVIIPADLYDIPGKKFKQPFVSVIFECNDGAILEEVGTWTKQFVIPRFTTISGSQYAYSPATIIGLPDARTLQAMSLTLLRAGEKYVDPPMLAVEELIRSDISLYAGGITMVDRAYDGRLEDVLRPLSSDKGGINLGLEMQQDVRQQLAQAFYLDKIRPPLLDKQMTAYEYSKLMEGWILDAAPLFEPTEDEYNGQLCDISFDILLRNGAFGPLQDIPEKLSAEGEVVWQFESPLHEAIEKQDTGRLLEARQLQAALSDLDPSVGYILDARKAARAALTATVPIEWLRSEQQVDEIANAEAAQAAQAQQIAQLQAGANAAETLGKAQQALTTV